MLTKYVAKNKNGEIKKGFFVPEERMQVYEKLKKSGFVIVSQDKLQRTGLMEKTNTFLGGFSRISLEDKMFFARQLAVMISAGVPLPRALEVLKVQARTAKFRKIIGILLDNVKKGNALSKSLSLFPKVFDNLFVNMIQAGEEGGSLDIVLNLLAKHLERDYSLRSKLRNAMIYPSLVIAIMLCVGGAMMLFVVPKLVLVFDGMGISLPFITRLLIAVSLGLKKYFFVILAGLICVIIFLKMVFSIQLIKKTAHFIELYTPIWGKISKKINAARFTRILGLLMKGGVPLAESLKITSGTMPNLYFKESLLKTAKNIQEGKTLHESLYKFKSIYPLLITQMVEVGEETGVSAEILIKLADFYEEEVDNVVKNASSIVEPAIMIVISIAVGFFAAAMLLPMYSIINTI